MKAPNFAFVKAVSLPQVFEALERYGADAKILAGGQSLLAALNLRLAAPGVLIDITAVDALKGISVTDGVVRIGALTRHADLARSPLIAANAPLMAQAISYVAHPAVRNRGTLGGSIAFADPAVELPACALALNAEIVLVSTRGERRVHADHFFTGLYETALKSDEIVAAIEIRADDETCRSRCEEIARRHGDFAVAGVAVHLHMQPGLIVSGARLVFFGLTSVPTLAREAGARLQGQRLSAPVIEDARRALSHDVSAGADLYHTATTKQHYAGVLLKRVLTKLGEDMS